LILTHHNWDGRTNLLWVSERVPEDFILLGRIPLSNEDANAECDSCGGWENHRIQPLLQWRWDHEREAVLAEDEQKRQQEEASREETRYGYLPSLSLPELRRVTPFEGWTDYPSRKTLRQARSIVRDLIDELIELEGSGDEASMLDSFRRAVDRFNAIEAGDDPFIESVERDHLCHLFEQIADAAGLSDYDVSAGRDW
jgi:hypothetical protein